MKTLLYSILSLVLLNLFFFNIFKCVSFTFGGPSCSQANFSSYILNYFSGPYDLFFFGVLAASLLLGFFVNWLVHKKLKLLK